MFQKVSFSLPDKTSITKKITRRFEWRAICLSRVSREERRSREFRPKVYLTVLCRLKGNTVSLHRPPPLCHRGLFKRPFRRVLIKSKSCLVDFTHRSFFQRHSFSQHRSPYLPGAKVGQRKATSITRRFGRDIRPEDYLK